MSLDRDWFIDLWHDHCTQVYDFAARRVGEAAADDVVEETFLVAWRRRHELPDLDLAWLYSIASNTIRNQNRSLTRRGRLVGRLMEQPQGQHVDVEGAAVFRLDLVRALDQLDDEDLEVLALRFWEGLDARDAARVVGCTPAAYTTRLYRARRRLRRSLDVKERSA